MQLSHVDSGEPDESAGIALKIAALASSTPARVSNIITQPSTK
jgi:hypothetical protein